MSVAELHAAERRFAVDEMSESRQPLDADESVKRTAEIKLANEEIDALISERQALSVTNTDNRTKAPASQAATALAAGASGCVEPTKAGPVDKGWVMKKAALIAKHAQQWDTIKGDFHSASENGLSNAAKAPGHGEWFEAPALNWARQRGKLKEAKQQGPANSVFSLAGKTHTIER